MFERIRDWWERMAPRERRLLMLLGVTTLICVFGWIGFQISDGLSQRASKNAETRDAIRDIEDRREEIAANRAGGGSVVARIGAEAEPLATYLEQIEGEVGVKISNVTPERVTPKGKFNEHALQVTLYDINVSQLATFLERIETKSPVVVTQKLHVKRSNNQPEKLDRVEVTVATYARPGVKREARAAAESEGGAAETKPEKEGEQ